jgi:hypothetical protein
MDRQKSGIGQYLYRLEENDKTGEWISRKYKPFFMINAG